MNLANVRILQLRRADEGYDGIRFRILLTNLKKILGGNTAGMVGRSFR